MLHRVHFIEKWGRGIKLILSKEPDAEFSEVGTKFITTFKRRSYFEGKKVVEGLEKGLADRLVERLAESQKRILKLIKENPYISKKELSEIIGISTTAIDKNIIRLKKEGLLKRIGPDKGGYWEVVRK
jgi:ATP-dependent DNA helicase RecG